MKDIKTLKDFFILEMKDLYDSERRMGKKLNNYLEVAQSERLKDIIEDHISETDDQMKRLDGVAERMEFDQEGLKCEAMKGIISEGEYLTKLSKESSAIRDAAIILALQKGRHYHIASYGAAVNYAYELGYTEEASLLKDNLRQEKEGDERLSDIASNEINPAAK